MNALSPMQPQTPTFDILLKSLSTKHEAQISTEMLRFSPKNVEVILLTYMFRQRYQQVGNRAMSKYVGDYVHAPLTKQAADSANIALWLASCAYTYVCPGDGPQAAIWYGTCHIRACISIGRAIARAVSLIVKLCKEKSMTGKEEGFRV